MEADVDVGHLPQAAVGGFVGVHRWVLDSCWRRSRGRVDTRDIARPGLLFSVPLNMSATCQVVPLRMLRTRVDTVFKRQRVEVEGVVDQGVEVVTRIGVAVAFVDVGHLHVMPDRALGPQPAVRGPWREQGSSWTMHVPASCRAARTCPSPAAKCRRRCRRPGCSVKVTIERAEVQQVANRDCMFKVASTCSGVDVRHALGDAGDRVVGPHFEVVIRRGGPEVDAVADDGFAEVTGIAPPESGLMSATIHVVPFSIP